jgi:hypothetical protein
VCYEDAKLVLLRNQLKRSSTSHVAKTEEKCTRNTPFLRDKMKRMILMSEESQLVYQMVLGIAVLGNCARG